MNVGFTIGSIDVTDESLYLASLFRNAKHINPTVFASKVSFDQRVLMNFRNIRGIRETGSGDHLDVEFMVNSLHVRRPFLSLGTRPVGEAFDLSFTGKLPLKEIRGSVIPPGVDLEMIAPTETRDAMRAALSFLLDDTVVSWFGMSSSFPVEDACLLSKKFGVSFLCSVAGTYKHVRILQKYMSMNGVKAVFVARDSYPGNYINCADYVWDTSDCCLDYSVLAAMHLGRGVFGSSKRSGLDELVGRHGSAVGSFVDCDIAAAFDMAKKNDPTYAKDVAGNLYTGSKFAFRFETYLANMIGRSSFSSHEVIHCNDKDIVVCAFGFENIPPVDGVRFIDNPQHLTVQPDLLLVRLEGDVSKINDTIESLYSTCSSRNWDMPIAHSVDKTSDIGGLNELLDRMQRDAIKQERPYRVV